VFIIKKDAHFFSKTCSLILEWDEVRLKNKQTEEYINTTIRSSLKRALPDSTKEHPILYCQKKLAYTQESAIVYAHNDFVSAYMYSHTKLDQPEWQLTSYETLNFDTKTGKKVNFTDLLDSTKLEDMYNLIIQELQTHAFGYELPGKDWKQQLHQTRFIIEDQGISIFLSKDVHQDVISDLSLDFPALLPYAKKNGIISALYWQKMHPTPFTIQWENDLPGDYSFINDFDYPLGVEMKSDGKAGWTDGGFCPERCAHMLDSNEIVLKDSGQLFYQLLDTTHIPHSIRCDAWCYEWAGTNSIKVNRVDKHTVFGATETGIATHCSLQLQLTKDTCTANIHLNSIKNKETTVFKASSGYIRIDKAYWKQNILKAEFYFIFAHTENLKQQIYWKGEIYAPIQ
jgi:hypothetical protein